MTREERLVLLVEKLEKYIKFVGVEHGELAVMASNRGWKSNSILEGQKHRDEITAMKSFIF